MTTTDAPAVKFTFPPILFRGTASDLKAALDAYADDCLQLATAHDAATQRAVDAAVTALHKNITSELVAAEQVAGTAGLFELQFGVNGSAYVTGKGDWRTAPVLARWNANGTHTTPTEVVDGPARADDAA